MENFIKIYGESERESFEHEMSHLKLERRKDGEYLYRYVQFAWEGWISCAYVKSMN